jgi:hypothetical protein
MNAVSGTILAVLLTVVWFGSRRWALLAMMAGVFFLTQGHSLNVAGFNLYLFRFLEMAAFLRVFSRRELVWRRLNRVDWTTILLYNYAALVWILRSSHITGQEFALAVDPTICYLALRALVGSIADVRWFLRAFVVLLLPFTALVFLERLVGQNSFSAVGATGLAFREGAARCMGPFRHAILLGSVAAAFLSLYIGLWLSNVRRITPLLGVCLCLVLVVLSNSGGPVTSAAAAFLGWSLWPLRKRMRLVCRCALALLLCITLAMKAPIWYLPFKISTIVGGGGYHRGLLMDQAWRHLDKWWLAGINITDTAAWFPYVHSRTGGVDVTNQFLVFGLRAGIIALLILVLLIVIAYQHLSASLVAARFSSQRGRSDEYLLWGMGSALLVHVVSWLGVSYFDQSHAVWLMHLAAVSASLLPIVGNCPIPSRTDEPPPGIPSLTT